MNDLNSVREKANRFFLFKILLNLALLILGTALVMFLSSKIQVASELNKQRGYCEESLDEAVKLFDVNRTGVEELTRVYHEENLDMVESLTRFVLSEKAQTLAEADHDTQLQIFTEIQKKTNIEYLFLLRADGTVALSSQGDYTGIDPIKYGLLSKDNLSTILRGTGRIEGQVIPVVEDNKYGKYYFYSVPCRYEEERYTLVLGASASILDLQIETLRDAPSVLDSVIIENNGFLFSADPINETFLYYDDGVLNLSGTSIVEAGLSAENLRNGYAGSVTLNGVDRYMVSRKYNDGMILCATADKDDIFANNWHVLFWTNMGFVLTLLLCLAYAIIIRDDFVRRSVATDRFVFHTQKGRTIFFDRTMFRKIVPLALVCVMAIFFITFYSQTLYELSEAVDRSNAAIDELENRESTGAKSRQMIQDYYDEHFLARARFVDYLLEEDASFLNEYTNLIHTYYDEDGTKVYLTDDYGNWLTSVPRSQKLVTLCKNLSLDSIYVFDEDGYTIATNTDNWYFVISRDPKDQSYAFLQVLDGKVKEYIQPIMNDDMGNLGQYIGVQFTYYITKDPDGSTRYISRKEYDELAKRRSAGEEILIDDCRSMLQIGLDRQLTSTLLTATDDPTVSAEIPGGGFLLGFELDGDHKCFFSPDLLLVGRTAEELGLTEETFAGSAFCGTVRIEGKPYFEYVRRMDDCYIATVTPHANVYRDRLPIALMTTLNSFILLLVLSASFVFTTDEEEALYSVDINGKRGLKLSFLDLKFPFRKHHPAANSAAHWDGVRLPWAERSAEQKLRFLMGIVGALSLLYIGYTVLYAERIFRHDSIVLYILSGAWNKGLNIFALSACGLVFLGTVVVILLIQIPFRLLSSVMGARTETICRLLLSVLKYGLGIGMLFYCLYLVGVNSTGLIASASVLSLVIGFGAQSLITDVIAGLFIVLEGVFRVGDIITVQDFRGTVIDISLRTTKVLGIDGNVSVFNNNDIKGVLNMTRQASYASVSPAIEYGQDIDYVEAVLKRELPKLKKRDSRILEAPEYLGVQSLGDSGVVLLIVCKCNEEDIKGLTRFLNRAILKIFYQYGINVPFPNVTVSQLQTEGRKTMDDLKDMTKPPKS